MICIINGKYKEMKISGLVWWRTDAKRGWRGDQKIPFIADLPCPHEVDGCEGSVGEGMYATCMRARGSVAWWCAQ